MYEVWCAAGDGLRPGPRFRLLADALRYIEAQPERERFGVRRPDGDWHDQPPSTSSVSPRVRRDRRHGPRTIAPARILVVDDDHGSRNALAELLRDERYSVRTAADGTEALALVDEEPPDLLITDVVMPNIDGFDLVAQLRARDGLSDMPIILVSGIDDATRRVDGLDLGADDYLPKPLDVDELLARIRVHLRHAHRSREIVARSAIDALTGLFNRRGILAVFERERERARRDGTPLAVFVIDVDGFKGINDEFGHGAGDMVLRRIADNLAESVRADDSVGRFGGDEFLIVAPGTCNSAAQSLARRIETGRRVPVELGGRRRRVSVSVGSAVDNGTLEPEELIDRADAAMYRHKAQRASR